MEFVCRGPEVLYGVGSREDGGTDVKTPSLNTSLVRTYAHTLCIAAQNPRILPVSATFD
jgi:hypothetical protein